MVELTAEELDRRYKEWLNTQPIKVYCSDYPVFLSEVFPEGVKVVNGTP